MTEFEQFFRIITENKEAILGILAALGLAGGAAPSTIKKIKDKKKKEEEEGEEKEIEKKKEEEEEKKKEKQKQKKKEEVDKKLIQMQAQIAETNAVIYVIAEQVKKLVEKQPEIDEKLNEMYSHAKEDLYRKELKAKLNMAVYSFLNNNKDLNRAMQSMIIEGGKYAYTYFRDIYELGFENIHMDSARMGAVQIFRAIRSGEGNTRVEREFQDHLKSVVVYPLVNDMLSDLEKFDGKYYNGKTPEKFIELASNFVEDLLKEVAKEFYKKQMLK